MNKLEIIKRFSLFSMNPVMVIVLIIHKPINWRVDKALVEFFDTLDDPLLMIFCNMNTITYHFGTYSFFAAVASGWWQLSLKDCSSSFRYLWTKWFVLWYSHCCNKWTILKVLNLFHFLFLYLCSKKLRYKWRILVMIRLQIRKNKKSVVILALTFWTSSQKSVTCED